MPQCSFSRTAALLNATPVQNLFIAEYMPKAPDAYVKVYLFGLMQCFNPALAQEDMGLSLGMEPQALAEAFRREHGSILCRELLARAGVADDGPQGSPQERTEAYYRSRPCVGFIRSAAALLEEQLAAEGRLLPFPCNDDNLYKEEP